jgi:hypothetical protein
MAREKLESFVSPIGTAKFPHLNTPDTKWKEEGEYHTKLLVPAAEGAAFAAKVDQAMKKALQKFTADPQTKGKKVKPADPPYKINEETGEYEFSFKMRASGISKKTQEKWTKHCPLFSKSGAPLSGKVGGGSTIRVSGEFMPFWTALVGAGVSLRLLAVQVLELREFGQRDAAGFGFELEASDEDSAKDEVSEAGAGDATETGGDGSDF